MSAVSLVGKGDMHMWKKSRMVIDYAEWDRLYYQSRSAEGEIPESLSSEEFRLSQGSEVCSDPSRMASSKNSGERGEHMC